MSWVATAVVAGVAGAGLSAYSSSTKKKTVDMLQYPEYPEAEGARETWWSKLQEWGKDPNYGAISPDWDNIWETVQRQVKEYYSGGPLTTGMRDKLKASVARRNMSDSPAADYLMMASQADEANKMKDIATEQGKEKAQLAETGRQGWLNSLMSLSTQKPSYYTTEGVSGGVPWADITGSVLSAGGQMGMQYASDQQTNDWLKKLLNQNQLPQSTQGSILVNGIKR